MTSIGNSRLSWPLAALIGLLSVGAALGTGHLVAGLVAATASPFLAVGNGAIDLTPGWLKDFAISTFGSNDKLALLIGMAVVIAIVAVLAGVLSRRSPAPGLTLVTALGLVGGIAVLVRPTAAALDVLAPLAALTIGLGAFGLLHLLGSRAAAGTGVSTSRRGLLVGAAAVTAGAGLAGLGGQLLAGRTRVEATRRDLGGVRPDMPAPPTPPGADFAELGTPTFITPNSEFYRIDVNLRAPQLRPQDWRLRIHGMVARELTLSWDDLRSMRSVERPVTMTCVSNEVGGPYISTANFTGVMLADILAAAGVREGADQIFTTSVDGWTCGTPTETVAEPGREAMLAYAMNREPLPVEHGFPVRMIVPGLYGFVSATKWITDMKLTTFAEDRAYWLQRDWGQRAPIKTMSRIDSPGSFERVAASRVTLAGIAWAQTVGIERVEVRLDGAEWTPAELSTEVNLDTWRMWRVRVPGLRPGQHTAEVRATDKSGYTQTPQRVLSIPDGATGWHSVSFTVQ